MQLGGRKSICNVFWQLTPLLTNGGGGGGFLLQPQEHQEFGDYWNSGVSCPIHVKEARSVVNALSALKHDTTDHRVDIFCDYLAVVKVWSNQGARDPVLNAVFHFERPL